MNAVDDSDSRQPSAARTQWQRPVMAGLAAVAAALLGGALVITYHNLRYSYARVLDILGGAPGSAGGLELTTVVVPEWVEPFMQDLSVVSPALVVFTAARMLVAALLLLRNPLAVRAWGSVHFPFPDPYKVYFIQMGLLGTIVGFVLAFAEVDPRAERQSLILLEALGTALWSTLTAIVLAYIVCPSVEAVYRRARMTLLPPEARDVRSALDGLRERTAAAATEFAVLSASTRELAEESRALGAELRDRRLDSRVARLEQRLEDVLRALDGLHDAQRGMEARQASTESDGRALSVRVDAGEQALGRHGEQIAATAAALAPLPEAIITLEDEAKRGREARTRIAALETWLRNLPPAGGSE